MVWFALIVSVGLFGLTFPNSLMIHGFSFGGWLIAIPFFFVLDGKAWWLRAVFGLIWGFLCYGLMLWWVLPLSWTGCFLFIGLMGLQGLIFSLLFCGPGKFQGRRERILFLFYLPSVWVVSEFIRNWICGGFTWGFGYSQSAVPALIQSARLGGVYAVSWLIIFFGAMVYARFQRKGQKVFQDPFFFLIGLIPVLLWVIGSIVMATDSAPSGKSVRIALIQPNIVHGDKTNIALYNNNVSRHLMLSKKSVQTIRPDIIVWPETAFTDDLTRDPLWRSRMEAAAKNFNAYFIIGSALLTDDGHDLNALLLLNPQGGWEDVYYKRQLVPFSEFIPADRFSQMAARISGMTSYNFIPGTRDGLFQLKAPVVTLAIAICSEEGYPALIRRLVRKGAGVLISASNDGWFARPESLILHEQQAVFRAVETARPVARAANTGWSVAIDPRGRVASSIAVESEGWVLGDIYPQSGQTFYVKFGDVFVGLCTAFVIIVLWRKRRDIL